MKSYDGRGAKTALTQRILDHYGLRDPQELIPLVYSESFSRERMAEVAKIALETAGSGDSVSRSIIKDAADDLCQLVHVLLTQIKFSGPRIPVVVTGGLFQSDSLLTELVRAQLEPKVQVKLSERPPVAGALLMARQIAGGQISEGFHKALDQIQ
jgi:N-acetylglucosamine kinase-like BadF-type ATPase